MWHEILLVRVYSSELHSCLKKIIKLSYTPVNSFEMISIESILLFRRFISLNTSDRNTLFETLLPVNQEVFPSTASYENGTCTSADGGLLWGIDGNGM